MLLAHYTDQICHGRSQQTSDAPIVLTGLLAAWLTSERPGNAITCFKNINPVSSRLRTSVIVDAFETGTKRLAGRAQFCPSYQITFSPRADK